jgi:hypothetical protein
MSAFSDLSLIFAIFESNIWEYLSGNVATVVTTMEPILGSSTARIFGNRCTLCASGIPPNDTLKNLPYDMLY